MALTEKQTTAAVLGTIAVAVVALLAIAASNFSSLFAPTARVTIAAPSPEPAPSAPPLPPPAPNSDISLDPLITGPPAPSTPRPPAKPVVAAPKTAVAAPPKDLVQPAVVPAEVPVAKPSSPAEVTVQRAADDIPLAAGSTAPPEAIYGPDDAEVAPPRVLRADLGNQRLSISPDKVVKIDLTIDANGSVETARIVPDASTTLSDAMLSTYALHIIRNWKFTPASRYGTPTRYRETLWMKGNGEQVPQP